MSSHQKVTYIGKVDYRNKELTFGIKEQDRMKHTYVIGKTGMGKSSLLENLAIQDMQNGEGVCFIDPHGGTAEKLLDFVPENRIKDVIYFAPFDDDHPIGLNVLEKVESSKRHLVANGLMATFKKIWKDAWSARMEYILNNILLALLESDGQTLLGVNRMLIDKEYRKYIVSNVQDPTVKDFWVNEYANYTERFAQEAAPAIQNKVGQFFGNPLVRNIIGQTRTSFNMREVMDQKKILIVNLSKGKVGEGNVNLIGSLLITKIFLAAMSRADVGPYKLEELPPFYLYVDEFQNFANESFADILSEARKYNLALTIAHQYVEQMTDEVKAAVFGNVGTMVAFRVGATDAEIFEKEFAPYFTADDIVNLSAYQIYLRLMIDNVGSKPFSAKTLTPIVKPAQTYSSEIIAYSRKTYGKSMIEVADEINNFYQMYKGEPKADKKPFISNGFSEQRDYRKKEFNIKVQEHKEEKKEEKREEKKEERRDFQNQNTRDNNNRREDNFQREPKKEEYKKDKVLFDEKPAMSLKEALAKAISEKDKTEIPSKELIKGDKQEEEKKRKTQEIPEDVLKDLIGE